MRKVLLTFLFAAAVFAVACAQRQPVRAKTYDQAVAELGQPLRCNDKVDGSTYCSWRDKDYQIAGGRRFLVIKFDRKGRVEKRYFSTTFGRDQLRDD